MSKVFLSYSSKDVDFVQEFYERLKADGVQCFYDRESIAWGKNWVLELEKALDECEFIVMIMTPDFCKSKWAELERTSIMAEEPAGLGKKVRPLMLKPCPMEIIHRFLRPIQKIDISSEAKYEKEYWGICRELGGDPKQEMLPEDRSVLLPVGKLPERNYMPHCSLDGGFKGRVKDLWDLDDLLQKKGTAVVQGVGVVVGMGGLGKSQLAIEYTHRFGKFYPGGVFWVDAEQGKATMIDRISRKARISMDDNVPKDELLQELWQRLGALPPSLVILDNFPNGEFLESWRPTQHNIRLLVTTRRKDFSRLKPLNLHVLDEKDGIALLNFGNRDFGDEAAKLVEMLGGLPLALELARKFLNLRPELSISNLIAEIKKRGELETLNIFAERYKDDLPSGHSKEVAATFQLSWDLATDFSKQVMSVIALLAPTTVPRYLLRKIFKQEENAGLEDPLADALSLLSQQISFLELDRDNDPICHRLIAAFVRNLTSTDTQHHEALIITLLDEMNRSYDTADTAALKELEKVLPHADHLLTQNHPPLTAEQQIDLTLYIGYFHSKWGRHRQALPYTEQGLTLAKKHYPDDHEDIAACLSNLGFMFNELGQYRDAIKYLEQALKIGIKNLGEAHPNVANGWNNLGQAYYSLGQYDKAIEYYEKALAIGLETYGPEHSQVAVFLNNLGATYKALGQYDKAIDYYQKALAIDLKNYGENHPQVAIYRNNLGFAYKDLGQNNKAIEYYEKALKSDLKTYGPEHPNVARVWNNLGSAYKALGQYDKAIEYYEKALASNLETYGPDHPDVATDWNNLGSLYYEMKEFQKARDYLEKALAVRKKMLGDDHPHTKGAQKWLRRTLAAMKK